MVNDLQQYPTNSPRHPPDLWRGLRAWTRPRGWGGGVPHNVGLGAARDSDLVERIGQVTATEMAATGVYWNFAPTVAVPQDIRWAGRMKGLAKIPSLCLSLGRLTLKVCKPRRPVGALRFMCWPRLNILWGMAAPSGARQRLFRNMLDQGVTDIDEAALRAIHLPPYQQALTPGP